MNIGCIASFQTNINPICSAESEFTNLHAFCAHGETAVRCGVLTWCPSQNQWGPFPKSSSSTRSAGSHRTC